MRQLREEAALRFRGQSAAMLRFRGESAAGERGWTTPIRIDQIK